MNNMLHPLTMYIWYVPNTIATALFIGGNGSFCLPDEPDQSIPDVLEIEEKIHF